MSDFIILQLAWPIQVKLYEGLDGGGVWYSLFIKNLDHYSSH